MVQLPRLGRGEALTVDKALLIILAYGMGSFTLGIIIGSVLRR